MNNKPTAGTTILVVEDDELLNKSIQMLLRREGFPTEGLINGSKALQWLAETSDNVLLLLDYSLPDMTGREVVAKIRERGLDIPFIIITGHGDEQLAVEMMKLGALDYVVKSIEFYEIVPSKVRRACEEIEGRRNLAEAKEATKRAEELLRESEERFRLILEYSPIHIFFKDENIRSLQLSRNFEEMLGRPMDELIGKSMDELFPLDFARNMVKDDKRVLSQGKTVQVEEEFNGRVYQTIKFPIQREEKPPLLAGFTIDITERNKIERALRESEDRFRKLADLLPALVYEMNANGIITYVNRFGFKMLGYTEEDLASGFSAIAIISPDDRSRVLEKMKELLAGNGLSWQNEYLAIAKDGSTFSVLATSTPMLKDGKIVGIRGVLFDITERKQAEEHHKHLEDQLRQAQKLEAVGQLAGGVAHDFNNLLGAIIGNAELIKMHAGEDPGDEPERGKDHPLVHQGRRTHKPAAHVCA